MPKLFQIGDVAERMGLTHRALHYYDEIGLLSPSVRLDGGLRLYTQEDMDRLERILEMRRLLGLSLHEIKAMLEAEDARAALLRTARTESSPESYRADLRKAMAIAQDQLDRANARLEQMRLLTERLAAEVRDLQRAMEASTLAGRRE